MGLRGSISGLQTWLQASLHTEPAHYFSFLLFILGRGLPKLPILPSLQPGLELVIPLPQPPEYLYARSTEPQINVSFSFPFFCVCMWCMRYEGICDHVQVWNGQSQPLGVFLWHSLAFCPESELVTKPEACHLSYASWPLALGICCVCPPVLGCGCRQP